MSYVVNKKNNKFGFSLLELILAVAIFSFGSFAMATLLIDSNISTQMTSSRIDALSYAKEGIEAVGSIRDNNWSAFSALADGNYGLGINSSSTWAFSSSSDLINNKYTRTVTISTDPIITSSKDVSVNVSWVTNSSSVASTTIKTVFSNWISIINNVVPDGLISHWLFYGNTNDSVGTYNGTVHGGATLTNGIKGLPNTAYSFNGSNSYISGLPGFGRDDNYTYSLWFKGNSFASGGGLLDLEYFQDGSNFVAFKDSVGTDNTLYCWAYSYVGGSRQDIICGSAAGIVPGQWYNFVFVWEGGAHPTAISYLNGSPIGGGLTPSALGFTWTASQMVNTNRIGDGCGYGWYGCGSWTDPFNGTIDDVRVYNRILSNDEIISIYNTGRP